MCIYQTYIMKKGELKPFPGDDEGKWEVLESKYLIKRPWMTVRCEHTRLPNGNECPEYYVLEYPSWINVIALTREGKMIMERQYRHALGVTRFELCAGIMDPTDKDPEAAARRELLEETGYRGGEWEEFAVLAQNPGSNNNLTHTFLARNVEPTGQRHLEKTEDIRVFLKEPQEVLEMLKSGHIIQALHAAPLWKFFYMLQTGEITI